MAQQRMLNSESRLLIVTVAVALGTLLGFGSFTFVYAEGDSYLTDDPQACINCHAMQDQYGAWLNSSHGAVAVCNDCHAPHGSLAAKYAAKAMSGLAHSWAFTSGRFPDQIRITEGSLAISEAACRHCHSRITEAIDSTHSGADALSCVRCHEAVGHGP